jgi:hypothetical protein
LTNQQRLLHSCGRWPLSMLKGKVAGGVISLIFHFFLQLIVSVARIAEWLCYVCVVCCFWAPLEAVLFSRAPPQPITSGHWMQVLPAVACRLSGATKVMELVPVYGARMFWEIVRAHFHIHVVYGLVLWHTILSLKGKTLREIAQVYSLCIQSMSWQCNNTEWMLAVLPMFRRYIFVPSLGLKWVVRV